MGLITLYPFCSQTKDNLIKCKLIILGVILALTLVTPALSTSTKTNENYGGVSSSTKAQMIHIIYAEFGHNWRGDAMVRCANRESGFNPRAANWGDLHGGSFGLLQINGVHDPTTTNYASRAWIHQMWNPYLNVKVAHSLMRGGGLGPWGGSC